MVVGNLRFDNTSPTIYLQFIYNDYLFTINYGCLNELHSFIFVPMLIQNK